MARDDETRSTLLLSCPNHESSRWKSYEAAGTDRYKQILGTEKDLGAVARWVMREGLLGQFSPAKEQKDRVEGEDGDASERAD